MRLNHCLRVVFLAGWSLLPTVAQENGSPASLIQQFRFGPAAPQGGFLGAVLDGGSPAVVQKVTASGAALGMRPGDRILAVDGQSVANATQVMMAVRRHMVTTPGTPLRLTVERNGQRLELSQSGPAVSPVRPGERVLVDTESQEILDRARSRAGFQVPAKLAQVRQINVLTGIVREPASGRVLFLGTYDPAYDTGPLPYGDWLAEALQAPEPELSLEGSGNLDALSSIVDDSPLGKDIRRAGEDPAFGKAWAQRLFGTFLKEPSLVGERERYFERMQRRWQLQPSQLQAYLEWNFSPKRGLMSDAARAGFLTLCHAAGYTKAGAALCTLHIFSETPAEERAMNVELIGILLEQTGLTPLLDELRRDRDQGRSDAWLGRKLTAAIYERIFTMMKMPEPRYRTALERYQREGSRAAELDLVELLRARTADLIAPILFGPFICPPALLAKLYPQVPPSRVELKGGLAPSMSLARVFLESDYLLKYMDHSGAPGEDPIPEQLGRLLTVKERPNGTFLRSTWKPDAVELEPNEGGTFVRVGASRIQLESTFEEVRGGDASIQGMLQEFARTMAKKRTERYDDLCRSRPALHRLREATKVIALVRWASDRKVALAPERTTQPTAIPRQVEGFWTLELWSVDDISYTFLGVDGGVNFGRTTGGSWVKLVTAPAGGHKALDQLSASAAMAEKAVEAAASGDLESARALAEQSVQAMSGQLDLATVNVPLPQAPVTDPFSITQVTQATLAALEQPLAPGAPPQTTDFFRQLQTRMTQAQAASKPSQPSMTGMGSGSPGPTSDQIPASPADDPARWLPTLPVLHQRLCELQGRLSDIQDYQRRVSAALMRDAAESDAWAAKVREAQREALKDGMNFLKDGVLWKYEKFLEEAEVANQGNETALKILEGRKTHLERLNQTLATKDLDEWATADTQDWLWFKDAALQAIDTLKLSGKTTWTIKGLDLFLKAQLHLRVEILAWLNLRRLETQRQAYTEVLEASAMRSRELLAEIHEVKNQVGEGKPCP